MQVVAALVPAGILWCLGVCLITPSVGRAAAEASNVCDPGLRQGGGADGYQMRGDRCEGLYAQPLSTVGGLRIVSLARVSPQAELKAGEPLRVAWVAPNDRAAVHLRGSGLKRRVYYRMDSVRPAGGGAYAWPTEVLRNVGLSLGEVGVLGWVDEAVGTETRQVILPLQIGPTVTAADPLQATIVSDERLNEVYLTLFKLGPDGSAELYLENETPLKRGYYPAGVGIAVPIPKLPQPGLYAMELGATFGDSGSLAASAFLYNPGPGQP